MGVNNEEFVNRRQLLVRAGSFMKMSWRKSREELIDSNEDGSNGNSCLRRGGKEKKRNLFVRFSDDLHVVLPCNRDELMSDEEITNRWYQSGDYSRFKKDTILTSLNCINAKRASKSFDETINCIWGIEEMCYLTPTIQKRNMAEKKHVFKVIREEQARQKKEMQQKRTNEESGNNDKTTTSPRLFPDLERFRSVSVCHTKGGRDRAIARGSEYARAQQRSQGLRGMRNQSSMKNLFASLRTQSAAAAS